MRVSNKLIYEAKQYTRNGIEAEQVANWCNGKQTDDGCIVNVDTDEEMCAKYGSWIVETEPGRYSVYSNDGFLKTFQQV